MKSSSLTKMLQAFIRGNVRLLPRSKGKSDNFFDAYRGPRIVYNEAISLVEFEQQLDAVYREIERQLLQRIDKDSDRLQLLRDLDRSLLEVKTLMELHFPDDYSIRHYLRNITFEKIPVLTESEIQEISEILMDFIAVQKRHLQRVHNLYNHLIQHIMAFYFPPLKLHAPEPELNQTAGLGANALPEFIDSQELKPVYRWKRNAVDLMEVITAFYKLDALERTDGQKITKKEITVALCWLFNLHIANPDSTMNAAMSRKNGGSSFLARMHKTLKDLSEE